MKRVGELGSEENAQSQCNTALIAHQHAAEDTDAQGGQVAI